MAILKEMVRGVRQRLQRQRAFGTRIMENLHLVAPEFVVPGILDVNHERYPDQRHWIRVELEAAPDIPVILGRKASTHSQPVKLRQSCGVAEEHGCDIFSARLIEKT